MSAEAPHVKTMFEKILDVDKPIEKLVARGFPKYIIEREVEVLYQLAERASKQGDEKTAEHARMFAEDHLRNAEKKESARDAPYISQSDLVESADPRLRVALPFLQRIQATDPSYFGNESPREVLQDVFDLTQSDMQRIQNRYNTLQALIVEEAGREEIESLIPAIAYPDMLVILRLYGMWDKVDPEKMRGSFGTDPVDEWHMPIKD
jgi:hypothetical protein